jgi:hypothetical protein
MGLFNRKPKTPDPEPRVIEIKPEHQMELRQLWDAYKDSKERRTTNNYVFWKKAISFYPELDVGDWEIGWTGTGGTFTEVE